LAFNGSIKNKLEEWDRVAVRTATNQRIEIYSAKEKEKRERQKYGKCINKKKCAGLGRK
jgi:hypothetical protein